MKKNITIFAIIILSCIFACFGDKFATGGNNSATDGNNSATDGNNSATIVFITDISNGYGRINPAMSTTFIVGAEDDKLNDMIKKYYDANNLLIYKQMSQEISYYKDRKPVLDLLVQIEKYIEANPRVMNRRYIGNRFVLTDVPVGSTLYCYPMARWNNGKNVMFWIKKIVVKPGENQIIFQNDYSAVQSDD